MARKLSSNHFLAAAAVLLGILAIFGNPYHRAADVEPLAADEIAWIDSLDVARELVEGRTDLRLFDLRDPTAYETYHLPLAESVSVDQLADYGLDAGERVVLYGEDHDVAQGLAILRNGELSGAKALRGGMSSWQEQILHPVLAEQSSPEQIEEFLALRGISLQLGGEPVGGGDLIADQTAKPLPKIELPIAASLQTGGKKKASEGC